MLKKKKKKLKKELEIVKNKVNEVKKENEEKILELSQLK